MPLTFLSQILSAVELNCGSNCGQVYSVGEERERGSTVVGSGGILAGPGDGCEQRLVAGSEVDEQGAGSMEQELR